jgi:hypothetical protein
MREYAIRRLNPELQEQISGDLDLVTLNSKVISENAETINGEKQKTILVRQEVVDARYFDYGNLLDVTTKLRTGEIPAVDEILLALVDILDAVTLKIVRPFLLAWKLESHKGVKDVDVIFSEVHSNCQSTEPESTLSDAHKWRVEKEGSDVDLEVRQDVSIQDKHQTMIHAYQITFEHHAPNFREGLKVQESDRILQTETEGLIIEDTVETRRVSESLTTTANIENGGTYNLYEPVQNQLSENRTQRIYMTNKDTNQAVKDGLLTQDELNELNAQPVSSLAQPTKVAEYEEAGKYEHIPAADSSPDDHSVISRQTEFSQTGSLEHNEKTDIFGVMQQISDHAKSEQTMTIDSGFEAGQAIGTIHDRSIPTAGEDSSLVNKDSMLRSHAETSPEEMSQLSSVTNFEKPWGPDQRVETIVETKLTHALETDIQATQVSYTEVVHSTGLFREEVEDKVIKKERRAIIVVNETDSTLTNETQKEITTSTIFGKDVGGFLGKSEKKGPTIENLTSTPTQHVYEVKDQNIVDAIADGRLSQIELDRLGALLVSDKKGETMKQSRVADSGGNAQFKEGWADYLPLGSVVSAGVKSSYGIELSGSDYFWAAVDGLGTVATLGAGAALSTALRTTGKGIAKGMTKGSVKTVGKAFVKGGKKGAEVMGREMAQRGKEFLQVARTGEKVFANLAKGEFQKACKIVVSEAKQSGERVFLKTRDQIKDAFKSAKTLPKKTTEIALGKKSVGSRSGKVVLKKGAGKESFSTITGLAPNAHTSIGGYHYATDGYGRVKSVKGKLAHLPGERDVKNQVKAGRMGQPGDDGGHLIGAQFNGPKDAINVVPQNANLNRGEWKSMEMDWKRNLQEGKPVNIDIRPKYTGDSVRPSSFVVRYEVDGKTYRKVFINEVPRDTITTLTAVKGSQEGLKQVIQEG